MALEVMQFNGDYYFLSNFCPVDIEYEGQQYRSVEHAYQAAKFWDPVTKELIRTRRLAGEAKKEAKLRDAQKRRDWKSVNMTIMAELLVLKFSQEPFKTQLARTAGLTLTEGNWWGDRFWGTSLQGVGENVLGKMLMAIRDGRDPRAAVSGTPQQAGLMF